MECRKCGHKNDENSRYCSSCGKNLHKRNLSIKTFDYITQNNLKVKRMFLLVISMLLLVMSFGSMSKHNAGYIYLDGKPKEIHFTQSSLHYLEGFKHFLLDTDKAEYGKIVREQILDNPIGNSFASYEESYSHRNLIGYNFLVEDISFSRGLIILLDVTLIFLLIGLPLTLFVYLCIELQLKSDKKLRFEWVFLITGLGGLVLSRYLMPAYSFHVSSALNLKFYIILSFASYFGVLYIKFHEKENTKFQKTLLLKKAIYSLTMIAVIFFATSNFMNFWVSFDNEVLTGKINIREASTNLVKNYDVYTFSESSISYALGDYQEFNSTSSLNWDYFLRMNFTNSIAMNEIILYLRLYIILLFSLLCFYQIRTINKFNQYMNEKRSNVVIWILLSLYIIFVSINIVTIVRMNMMFNWVLNGNAFVLIYPSLFSFIPIIILTMLLKRQKKDNQ